VIAYSERELVFTFAKHDWANTEVRKDCVRHHLNLYDIMTM